MKRILLLLILFVSYMHLASAQQKPQYTQYIFNNFLLNPAVSGIENYTDVKAGYRSQWTGLQGAPVTSYLTVNAPIGNAFTQGDATAFPASGGGKTTHQAKHPKQKDAKPTHQKWF